MSDLRRLELVVVLALSVAATCLVGCGVVNGLGGPWPPWAGAGSAPPGWTCDPNSYGDGAACDCDCGVVDIDCDADQIAACEMVPGWQCAPAAYEDGATCDCGCGLPDPDCADGSRAACDVLACPAVQIVEGQNHRCEVPTNWRCNDDWYGSDDGCDCECGHPDPDCAVDECWGCADGLLTDGSCHCGCDGDDPDCPADYGVGDCDFFGTCPEAEVNPEAPGYCIGPEGWTCVASHYGDGDCDEGCGITDVDCP
jgi:hypothetical protein